MATRRQKQELAVGGGVIYSLGYLYFQGVGQNQISEILYWIPNYLNDLLRDNVSWVAQNLPNTLSVPIISFIVGFTLVMILTSINK